MEGMSKNTYIWIIAAVIFLIGGWLGIKYLIDSTAEYKVTLVDAPKEVLSGNVTTFTWRVDGPNTSISHTSVHFGSVSTTGELGKDVKPEDTKYTEMVQDFADGKFDIPLQFVGNTRVPGPGKYYFRVHATVRGKQYWTDEYTFEVKPADYTVSLLDAQKEVEAGKVTTFTWRVDGNPTTIAHTSVHYGRTSLPGEFGKEVKPADAPYTDLIKDFASGKYNIPLQFVGNTKILSAGTYYYRAHAIINEANYWTSEYTLEVKNASVSGTRSE